MPTNYNWPFIQSGETFQALVNTLLQFEIPGIRVFGRAGRDSGQDARSADNKIVFQYKHHTNASISKTISDATTELTKISKYRQATDSRYFHWQHAEEWILITNLLVNANDGKRWDDEVVTESTKLGIKATLWSLEKLEALLSKYPHVADAFFGGQNRCFLSLGEAFEFTRADEIGESGLKVALLGREREISHVDAFFIGTKKVLWVHGPGGIGKSRLLLEVGKKAEAEGKQVLWAVEATMSQNSHWLSAVNCSVPTVLLVDEPQDPDLIRVLAEQIRNPNPLMRDWKVIIAVRSPNDPVLKAVTNLPPNLRADSLVLPPLTREVSKKLALELIESSPMSSLQPQQKEDISEHLSQLGDRFPIWIAMAVNVLAKHGNLALLPVNADDIARKYVDEVIERSESPTCNKGQLQSLLRWLAAYEELDVQEASLVSFISKQAGFVDESRFHECLNSLVIRKFVVRRGVNQRLYSIKPDVVRDFVVRDWLTLSVDNRLEATAAAKGLVSLIISGHEGKPLPEVRALVRALAKAELVTRLNGATVELLSPLVAELKRICAEGSVLEQQEILTFIDSFDFARLGDALDILCIIRKNKKSPQRFTDFFENVHEVSHDTVVAQLAWPLFHAARYARTESETSAVLKEMMNLAISEASIPELFQNDGKHAAALIPRMISGENDLYPYFKSAALHEAMALVAHVRNSLADEPTLNLVKILCTPFLSIEKENTSFKQHTFTSKRWLIPLDSPEGLERSAMRTQIQQALEDPSTPEETRLVFWHLLSSAHSSANRAIIHSKDLPDVFIASIKEDLKADLGWTLNVLRVRKLDLAELRAARELWDWHYRFDKDDALKNLAAECEQFYQQVPLVQTFHVFFSWELYEQARQKAAEVGTELGTKGNREAIRHFIQQAREFAPAQKDFTNVLEVARQAAFHWESNIELATFAFAALATEHESLEFQFALAMLNGRLRMLREANRTEALSGELLKAIQASNGAEAKARLLSNLYARPHPLITGILTSADLDFALEQMDTVDVLPPWTKCQLLAGMHHVDWERVKSILQGIYTSATEDARLNCFAAILDAMHFLNLFRKELPTLSINKVHFHWLLDLMVTLPDIDKVGEVRQHEFDKLIEQFGRRELPWLITVLDARTRVAQDRPESDKQSFKLVPTRLRLSLYVQTISPEQSNAQETRQQLGQLLGYAERKDILGYILPKYAADIDPHGLVIPSMVSSHIDSAASNKEVVWEWARFAGSYAFNSDPWRVIAKAAVRASIAMTQKKRISVFVELLPQGIKSSSYAAGTMDPRPEQDLLARKEELQNEKDPDLLQFRQWHLASSQAEYDHAVAQYKEENEE